MKINDEESKIAEETDTNGNALMIFSTPKKSVLPIQFEITAGGQRTTFSAKPYTGDDQIHVNQLIRANGEMTIQSVVQGIGKTGIMHLILSRGQYIQHNYFKASTEQERVVSNDVQEQVSPEARVVAFFVSQNGRLVADSSRFPVIAKCRGKGLTLKPKHTQVYPDDRSKLTVTGSPNMAVGLNIMDKALLLLDNDNVLRQSKMFKLMMSHDLGCGEGGGVNAENVFRDAGVTVISNVNINAGSLDRTSMQCNRQSRKKRSEDCYGHLPETCCDEGREFATDVLFEYYGLEDTIVPETICQSRMLFIAEQKKDNLNKYSTACLKAFFLKCVDVMYDEIEESGIFGKSANDGANDYLAALNEFGIDEIPIRKNFKDSWLFKSMELDDKGNSDDIALIFPSSITTWMIQAVGITENQGLCIAEPKNVTAFKPVFIQLDMPFKASRLEYFDLKVTVFNYKEDSEAKLSLFITPVDGLCLGADDPDEKLHIDTFSVKGNEAKSLRVPILPLHAQKFPIQVEVVGRAGQETVSDAIKKDLLVVNEGIEERDTITVCLDPGSRDKNSDCVDDERVIRSEMTDNIQTKTINMTLPGNALVDTGSAYGYATSNVMDDVVRTILTGIDNMLRKPNHCGEQTMIYLGPSVYVMSYWKNTKQMTADREERGNSWVRAGVHREVTKFRKFDGSYAAWRHRGSSTWLTAFVGKVFCQAKRVVDDVDIQVVQTLEWLTGKMDGATGAFRDDKVVIHREMIGQINERDPSLTAFVLITLLECDIKTAKLNTAKTTAITYLEKISDFTYRRNPYLLAISTYALAKAGSRKKYKLKDMLLDISHQDRGTEMRHWGKAIERKPATAQSVETTAYALLALMEYPNEWSMAGQAVRWLNHQRSAAASFRTTQDTVIGLQALSEYTIKSFSANVDLDIKLSADGFDGRTQTLTNKNRYLLETIKGIPVDNGQKYLKVVTKGVGSGQLVIDYSYNRPETAAEKCAFSISEIKVGGVDDDADIDIKVNLNRKCDICGCVDNKNKDDNNIDLDDNLEGPIEIEPKMNRKKRAADVKVNKKRHCITFSVSSLGNARHEMSIIDVGLETGMQVVQSDLDKMKDDGLIDMYEMPGSDKGFFILYLDSITPKPVEFKFRLEEQFEIEKGSRQPSRIHVYDYYKPELECIKFYGTGEKGSSPVKHICEKSVDNDMKKTCSCLKNVCPDANQAETLYNLNKVHKRKPAKDIYEKICVLREAHFAIIMTITGFKPTDYDSQIRTAIARVEKVIHKGSDKLTVNTEIILYWRLYCEKELVKLGQKYYLVSRDGEKSFATDGTITYKYQLMNKAIIVEWDDVKKMKRGKPKFVQQMMKKFVALMKDGCKQ